MRRPAGAVSTDPVDCKGNAAGQSARSGPDRATRIVEPSRRLARGVARVLLVFRGNRLRLNIDTGAIGTAFVELQDADGRPIPGFTLADCEEIGGNFLNQRVYWKGSPDVASLVGRPCESTLN